MQQETASLPARLEVGVSGGALGVLGLSIPLPIKGTGQVDLMYLDRDLRIFRSPDLGSTAVQMRSQ